MKRWLIVCLALALSASATPPNPSPDRPARRIAGAASGDGFVLIASYDPGNWSGDLVRVELGATTPTWSASDRLPAPAERNIFTSTVEGGTVEFIPGAVPGLDHELIGYLRGDRSGEGKGMRSRASALGDIVRSVPVIVGPPSPGVQAEGYDAFLDRHARRKPVAYIGANDGMLHAFDIATGVERFAYVPRAVQGALAELARTDYRHRAYVDAAPGAGEAHTGSAWRTVLASGFGMDQKGLFAIDITDPDRFDAGAGELWQFTSDDDSHMGHIVAAPLIARFRTVTRGGEARYRYFVIVPGGLSNHGSGNAAEAALFLLALDKRDGDRWRKGANYYRFDVGDAAGALGPPALVPGPDGSVHYVYAGDSSGQLWRFDFTGAAPWRNAASLLFTASDGEGRRQPVSTAPRIVFAPKGGHLVLFGTSDLEGHPSGARHSLYAVHDPLTKRPVAITRKALTPRRLDAIGKGYRIIGADIDFDRSSGWYIDFSGAESIASSPMVDGGVLVASTTVPEKDAAAASTTRTYVLSAVTGMTRDSGSTTGIARIAPVPPLLVRTGSATGATDATGRATSVRRYSFVPLAPGEVPPPVDVAFPARRLSWREIVNWDDLHRAATEGEEP